MEYICTLPEKAKKKDCSGCEHCGWEYDNTRSEDEYSAANSNTIKEYREKYLKQGFKKG